MTREESTKIVDKIKIYRQSFLITNSLYQEWFRVLEPYDYDDVDKKLDEYFKNSDNFGKYPDAYYLTKYLTKHDEKERVGIINIRCQICGCPVNLKEHDKHYERCRSVNYLCLMSKKYFGKELSRNKLMQASEIDFEKYYWNFCNKLYAIMKEDDKLKHILQNAILTHNGYQPKYSIRELV